MAKKINKKEQMLQKIHAEFAMGNPSAIRMMNLNTPSYQFKGNELNDKKRNLENAGTLGTHYMSSTDNFVVPYIQQNDKGQMYFNSNASPRDKEAMRFPTEEDAIYFGEHYKEVAPMMQSFKKGGTVNQIQTYTPVSDNTGTKNTEAWRKLQKSTAPKVDLKKKYPKLEKLREAMNIAQYLPEGYEDYMRFMGSTGNASVDPQKVVDLVNPVEGAINLREGNDYYGDWRNGDGIAQRALDFASLLPGAYKGIKGTVNEIKAIPEIAKDYKQYKKAQKAGAETLTKNEANLLKKTRVLGSIFNSSSVDESKKLQQILNNIEDVPDEALKNITGMNKEEIYQKLEQLKAQPSTVKKTTNNVVRDGLEGLERTAYDLYQSSPDFRAYYDNPNNQFRDNVHAYQEYLEYVNNSDIETLFGPVHERPIAADLDIDNNLNTLIRNADNIHESALNEQIYRNERTNPILDQYRQQRTINDYLPFNAEDAQNIQTYQHRPARNIDISNRGQDIYNALNNYTNQRLGSNILTPQNIQRPQFVNSANKTTNPISYVRNELERDRMYESIANNRLQRRNAPNVQNLNQSFLEKAYSKYKNELPITENENAKSLISFLGKSSDENPGAKMLSAYKTVKEAKKGEKFIPSGSLSADSYPMSLKLIEKANREGIANVNYHGQTELNGLGFPNKAGLDPNIVLKESNEIINNLNKTMDKKIPLGFIDDNGMIKLPSLSVERKKYGGTINNNDMKKYRKGGKLYADEGAYIPNVNGGQQNFKPTKIDPRTGNPSQYEYMGPMQNPLNAENEDDNMGDNQGQMSQPMKPIQAQADLKTKTRKSIFPKIDYGTKTWNPFKKDNAWNTGSGISTNDIAAVASSVIAGALPYQQVNQNNNPLQMGFTQGNYGYGSSAAYKNGGAIAANGMQIPYVNSLPVTPQERSKYNQYQGSMFNQPGKFVRDYNHNQDYQKSMANKVGFDYNRLGAIQQDLNQLSMTQPGRVQRGANMSPNDGWNGTDTMQERYTTYGYAHNRADGSKYYEEHGTEPLSQQEMRGETPQGFVGRSRNAQTQEMGQAIPNTSEGQWGSDKSGYVKQNQSTGDGSNPNDGTSQFSAANGITIPMGKQLDNQLQVNSGKLKPLSDNTYEFVGPSHAEGGIDINYNGTPVEVEGGETIHVDDEGQIKGNAIVGGNMYVPGTKTKYKTAFKEIAKVEKKADKAKSKAGYFLNNYDQGIKHQASAFNYGEVMSDKYKQENAEISEVKKKLTDMQEYQLQLKAQQEQGYAKDGIKVPSYLTSLRNHVKNTPPPVYTPQTEYYRPNSYDLAPVPSKYSLPAQSHLPSHIRVPNTNSTSTNNSMSTSKKQSVVKSSKKESTSNNTEHFLPLAPVTPQPFYNKYVNGHMGYMPELGTVPASTGIEQALKAPELMAVPTKSALDLSNADKLNRKKGMRNKFNVANYAGEIMTMFDKAQPVQSMQVNPLLESEYNMSLQQKKNSIMGAYKPALNSARSAAQKAAITAQMAEQLGAVDSEEFTMNQQNIGAIRGRNAQEMRGVRDTNMKLGMDAIAKTDAAKENTRSDKYRAAATIAQKEAMRRAANNQLQMTEDYAGWAYDNGQYYMNHPGTVLPTYTTQVVNPYDTEEKKTKKTKEKGMRNGKPYSNEKETEETKYFGGKIKRKK